MYDVIIVGAGPAGSICAQLLGRQKVNVLLIDKANFPRDKICGDFISARLVDRMKPLGLPSSIKQSSQCVIDDLLLSHPSTGSLFLKNEPNNSNEIGFVCKREILDNLFFEEAKKYVDVLTGTPAKKLIYENGYVIGVETATQQLRAKIVVGADGANGITAKALGAGTLDENHHAVAIRSYYTNVKELTKIIELYFIDEVQPGYFWIFPIDPNKGEANVGLGILSKKVRYSDIKLKELQQHIISQHPEFRGRFENAVQIAPVKGWPLPLGSKKRPKAFHGAILIGDAGGLIDPLSGEGIENAFRSAECAAKIILKALQANDFSYDSLSEYERNVEIMLRSELRRSYIIQKLSRNPILLKAFFCLLKNSRTARRLVANKFF